MNTQQTQTPEPRYALCVLDADALTGETTGVVCLETSTDLDYIRRRADVLGGWIQREVQQEAAHAEA